MSKRPAPIPAQAKQVLQAFLDASLRKDEKAMRACVTRHTLESGQLNSAGPEGVTLAMGEPQQEGEQWVIPVKAVPIGAPEGTPPVMEMPCLMVEEDGQWKFDLVGTAERMMAIDGSDLLYRMALPENEGFFSKDDELAALLPGVLAGLPETIEASVAGHRLLTTDDETLSVDLYEQRIAPRYMHRISTLLGRATAFAPPSLLGPGPVRGRTQMWPCCRQTQRHEGPARGEQRHRTAGQSCLLSQTIGSSSQTSGD